MHNAIALVVSLGSAGLLVAWLQSGPQDQPTSERHLRSLRQLTSGGENAEAYFSSDGSRLIFQATRAGYPCDQIYTMRADGSDVRRITNRAGPDGGPFFSHDGKRIAFRGRSLEPGKELDDYRLLLKQGLWRPASLELFVMDRDGQNQRQVTKLGGANFAPSWHPDGERLIFASNIHDPKGRNFDLYLINVDGSGLERVTFDQTFDGFPMFSPDGKRIVFASNRGAAAEGETNVFLAEWVD